MAMLHMVLQARRKDVKVRDWIALLMISKVIGVARLTDFFANILLGPLINIHFHHQAIEGTYSTPMTVMKAGGGQVSVGSTNTSTYGASQGAGHIGCLGANVIH